VLQQKRELQWVILRSVILMNILKVVPAGTKLIKYNL